MLIRPAVNSDIRPKKEMSRKSGSGNSSSVAGSPELRTEASPFNDILNELLPPADVSNLDLHGLWSRLPQAERDLIDNPSQKNLIAYKEIVKRILKQSVEKIFDNTKIIHVNRSKVKVEQHYIKILDEKLHKMTLMIQAPGNTAFNILRNLDDIRGLLIDVK
jgi:uncharacterized protein